MRTDTGLDRTGDHVQQPESENHAALMGDTWKEPPAAPESRPKTETEPAKLSNLPDLSIHKEDNGPEAPRFSPGSVERSLDSRPQRQLDSLMPADTGKPVVANRSLFPADSSGRHYHGEGIQRDIPPGLRTVQQGESLRKIAETHLGGGASNDQIKKYMVEIQKINGLDNAALTQGQVLNLPGHSADGVRFIVKDTEEGDRVIYPDGSFELTTKNGSDYSRFYDKNGSYREYLKSGDVADSWRMTARSLSNPPKTDEYQETHSGPRAEDNYLLSREKNGTYKIKDHTGEHTIEKYDAQNPDVRVERARLRDLAEKHVVEPTQLKRFEEDMAAFEARAMKLEETYKKRLMSQGKSADEAVNEAHKQASIERAKTYHELSRLMETTEFGKAQLKPPMGAQIALRTLLHLADPTTIDQGRHPTCQTASVQARIFTNDPSQATRLVADAVIKGEYTTPDGKTTVQVDPKVLELGPRGVNQQDPSPHYPPTDGERSYVSQLWQYTAINVALQRTGLLDGDGSTIIPAGKVRYEQRDPDFSANPPDNGERIIDLRDPANPKVFTEKDDSGKNTAVMAPSLWDGQITDMSNAITNQNEKAVVLAGLDYLPKDTRGIHKIESAQQLEQVIQDAKKNGQLPLIVKIDAKNAPFWGDSGGGKAGGSGAAHVVTITDYRPAEPGSPTKPAQVDIDNQWGKKADRTGDNAMSVQELFMSMHKAGGTFLDKDQDKTDKSIPMPGGGRYFIPVDGVIDMLQKQVDSGNATPATQIELIRQKVIHDFERRKQPKADYPAFFKDDKELETATAKAFADAVKMYVEQRSKGDPTYSSREERAAVARWNELLAELPPASRTAVGNKVIAEMNEFFRTHPHLKAKPSRRS